MIQNLQRPCLLFAVVLSSGLAAVGRPAAAESPGAISGIVVDGNDAPLPWPRLRVRLEALDGHAFLLPNRSAFVAPAWSTFASSMGTILADKGKFSASDLASGDYAVDVISVGSTRMTYHGRLAPVRVNSGKTTEIRVKPSEYDTSLIVPMPSPRTRRPELSRSMLVISRDPGLALWSDGKVQDPESPRLKRIIARALIASTVAPTDYQVKNLPPGTYSVFAGPPRCLKGARVEVVAGKEITCDVQWTIPATDQVAAVDLSHLDRTIALEEKEYSAKQLCGLLSERTESCPRFLADPAIESTMVRRPGGETVIWEVLEAVYLATGWRLDEQGEDTMLLGPAPEPPPTCRLAGRVLDGSGAPVAGACVYPCRQDTGSPLSKRLDQTFAEAFETGRMEMAFRVTDAEGRFAFDGMPPGAYRFLAQSWKDAESVESLLEVNGTEVVLHGIAENIEATPDSSPEITIRPLGTGTLQLDQQIGNDETLLVVSTAPPRADPILGFLGWGGPFLQKMICGNRMPRGKTIVHGLPEGTVYFTLFAADNVPGFGAAQAEIKAGKTTFGYASLVAGWSDGRHDPPPELADLLDEVKLLIQEDGLSIGKVLEDHGIRLKSEDMELWSGEMGPLLAKEIQLPNGRKTTFADLMAVSKYLDLQRYVEQRNKRAQRSREMRQMEQSLPEGARQGQYAEAFLDLYQQLGSKYPCFELKGIDWKAVGEELLPRVQDVKTDEQFGLLVMRLVARLEDSHAYVAKATRTPPTPPYARWDPGFACLLDDRDKPVVYYVDKGGPAKATGVKVGMTVLSINGEPAGQAMEECMNGLRRYQGYSSERYLRYQAARFFPRQMQRGATVSVEMQTVDGTKSEFDLPAVMEVRYLPRLPVPIEGVSDSANVSWTMLEGNIGYIYVRRIRQDLIERLDQAVGELKGAAGLIVDVRGNSGGGFDAARSHRNFIEDGEEPGRPRFDGPMALLIDARCISAGEGWASWFIANDRARVFGETTAGASSRKTRYRLKNDYYEVTFPVKAYQGFLDRPIERRGLEPAVPLMQNAADLAGGLDTVLEAARKHLQQASDTK